MAYPIFDDTMVELSWIEIEKFAQRGLPVILPISIIEEHGPHMDLAPDVYLVHKLAKDVKCLLSEKGVKALISPPMFWGISECTAKFPGTFSVKPETMILLLVDLVSCLYDWGFKKVFILNVHGDPLHIQTIIKAIEVIKSKLSINIYFPKEKNVIPLLEINEINRINIIPFENEVNGSKYSWSEFADIHAGGEETSSMQNNFPNSVFMTEIPKLKDSKVTYEQLADWKFDFARKLTPLGYMGNPSNINLEAAKKIDNFIANSIATEIYKLCKLNNTSN
jgi:creatinine amidohydrolase